MEVFDKDGNKVEGILTQSELEEVKKGLEKSKQEEIDKVQNDLKLKDEELKGYRDKDLNFQKVREAKEKAELEAQTYKKLHDEAIANVKTEVLSGMLKDEYNSLTKNLLGDDEELKKKFETEYNRLNDKPTSKEELQKKVMDAYRHATDVKMPTLNSGVISAANTGRIRMGNTPVPQEDAEMIKTIAAKGGVKITDEDLKKHYQPYGR